MKRISKAYRHVHTNTWLSAVLQICDGDAEVRRAARDELRRGAHCIKVMASGGVASPTDK